MSITGWNSLFNDENLIVTTCQFCRLVNYMFIAFVVTYYELCILLHLHTVFMIVIDLVEPISFKGHIYWCEFV